MRIYGEEPVNSAETRQGPAMQGPPMPWGAPGAPMGFHPFAFYGHPRMMGSMPHPHGHHPHCRGRKPKTAEPTPTIPPFAKKWFNLDQSKRKELRAMRDQWVSAQLESGNQDAEKDLEGLQTVLPKFAAKWFVLSDDQKRQYFMMNRREQHCNGGKRHIPPFAARWFELPESKRNELREHFKQMRATMKSGPEEENSEIQDGGAKQPEPEVDIQNNSDLPKFAAKWFDLPQRRRAAIRMRYCRRHHAMKHAAQQQALMANAHDCKALPEMMAMLQLQRASQAPAASKVPSTSQVQSAPGNQVNVHPMMIMSPYGVPTMMPWQQQFGHFRSGHCRRPMSAPGFVHPCRRGRFARQQQQQKCGNTSDSETTTKPGSPSNDGDCSKKRIPPPFVRKWLALPEDTRAQMRMMKQAMKKKRHCQTEVGPQEDMPPFVRRWFELKQQRRQQWRKWNRGQVPSENTERTESGENDREIPIQTDDETENVTPEETANAALPDFVQSWFALPCKDKRRYRMMNQNKTATSQQDNSEISDDGDNTETMPDFALQWFALDPKEQQRFRQIKRAEFRKQCKGGHMKRCAGRQRFRMHPWQKWALYQQMQQMRNSQPVFV